MLGAGIYRVGSAPMQRRNEKNAHGPTKRLAPPAAFLLGLLVHLFHFFVQIITMV